MRSVYRHLDKFCLLKNENTIKQKAKYTWTVSDIILLINKKEIKHI
jgi:hypothetical protein